MRTNQNFTLYRGYAKDIRFTLTDPDGAALTPAALAWNLRRWDAASQRPGDIEAAKALASGITLSDVGTYDVAILEADTTGLTPGVYYHELIGVVAEKSYLLAAGFATLHESGVD